MLLLMPAQSIQMANHGTGIPEQSNKRGHSRVPRMPAHARYMRHGILRIAQQAPSLRTAETCQEALVLICIRILTHGTVDRDSTDMNTERMTCAAAPDAGHTHHTRA